MLKNIGVRRIGILQSTEHQIDKLQERDNELFESNGRMLKRAWQQVHHRSNIKWIERFNQSKRCISEVIRKINDTSDRFRRICGSRKVTKNKISKAKERKNRKKNEKRKGKCFKSTVDDLVRYILASEGQTLFLQEFPNL